jgi:4-amino-4-deoxy-L-arabinose transferase-like glycosyltransferase
MAATLAFAAVCLGFLLNTPTYFAPDEPYHFDRVIAAEHGQIVLAPGSINMSLGARGIESQYVSGPMRAGTASQADFTPKPRNQRPSLDALGGNSRSPAHDVANYETQHPPLYYALMGGLLRLWPGADAMAGDKLVMLVRAFNVLLLLPLPLLYFVTARRLVGDNAVARSAAFLPLLVPGIARGAATVNNDNLALLLGSLVVLLAVRVMMGDRSARTAVLVAATCTAGSLTKATVLFLLVIVVIAYAYQWRRARSWPDLRVIIALALGAVGTTAWWIHDYVAYGSFQPSAWGSQYALAQGPVRTATDPVNYHLFLRTVWTEVLSRFWGALGVLEPPELPRFMIDMLTLALVVFAFAAIYVMRNRRGPILALIAVPAAIQLLIITQAFLHFRHYDAIPGLQGRYVYPGIFGVMLPFSLAAVALLRRWSKWAPLLMCAVGLLVSGWALYTSVEYMWLHQGERLGPSNWGRAFSSLERSSPVSPAVTITLAIAVAVMIVAAVGGTVWSCWGGPGFQWGEVRGAPKATAADERAQVTTFAPTVPTVHSAPREDSRPVGYGESERAERA